MKISLSWLNDYIDIKNEKPEAIAQALTQAGLEVEEIIDRAKDYQSVVTGVILEKAQHPGADRLTVCQVSTGQGIVHQIVCGAKNHKQGDHVVVSLPGAVLPGNFAIKKSAIRGVESGGMLCSEVELGLATESPGIMILPKDSPLGVPFAEYMKLNDVTFELKVTPNRSDCLSHFGLARELSALLGLEYHLPFQPFTESSGSSKKEIALEVKETELCPRYAGRVMKGVKVGPSPVWLKSRIEAVGLKSINNVVDVTNYVMMELGQPLHAFDIREIKGAKITVAKAKAGETFKTLDQTDLKLTGTELTIRDGERAVALAGVIGGINSGIKDDTKDLFIESAYFTAGTVRRTSRQHGIETDSSYRFARGVNPEAVLLALNRACELIHKVAGGDILKDPHDNYPNPVKRQPITVTLEGIVDRLGYKISEKEFTERMESIECQVEGKSGQFKVVPPLYRWDITIAEDLVEEFSRLNGYDKIPETLPAMNYAPTNDAGEHSNFIKVNQGMRRQGFHQAVSFTFVHGQKEKQTLGDVSKLKFLKVPAESIPLKNPLSEDLGVMRRTLSVSLINTVSHNVRYGYPTGRVFESGFVFRKEGAEYVQEARLGLAAWGVPETLWQKAKSATPLVFEAKARLQEFFKGLRIDAIKWEPMTNTPDFVHPGQSVQIVLRGETVGFLGAIHPGIKEEMKLRSDFVLAEIDLEKVFKAIKTTFKVSTPSKFPSVERDLAFVLPATLQVADVLNEIKKSAGPILTDVGVFDVFPLEEGKRSIAFRLQLQDQAGTLNEEALTAFQDKVVKSVTQKLGVQIRS